MLLSVAKNSKKEEEKNERERRDNGIIMFASNPVEFVWVGCADRVSDVFLNELGAPSLTSAAAVKCQFCGALDRLPLAEQE